MELKISVRLSKQKIYRFGMPAHYFRKTMVQLAAGIGAVLGPGRRSRGHCLRRGTDLPIDRVDLLPSRSHGSPEFGAAGGTGRTLHGFGDSAGDQKPRCDLAERSSASETLRNKHKTFTTEDTGVHRGTPQR